MPICLAAFIPCGGVSGIIAKLKVALHAVKQRRSNHVKALACVIIRHGTYVAVDAKYFLDQNNSAARRAVAFGYICVEFVAIFGLQFYFCHLVTY